MPKHAKQQFLKLNRFK